MSKCRRRYFPPHPSGSQKVRREQLPMLEKTKRFFFQRKFNGTHVVLYVNPKTGEMDICDRRCNSLTLYKLTPGMKIALLGLNLDENKEYVLDGELLHTKAVNYNVGRQAATDTIVLFDVLFAGHYLIDTPFERRLHILHDICRMPTEPEPEERALIVQDVDTAHLWLAEVWEDEALFHFDEMWDYHSKTGHDLHPEIEGLMCKERGGMLLAGDRLEDVGWIIKCRKEKPKMYMF